MSRIGRSARTREQRLARRQADVQGFDRGGGRRSIFRSRYAKIFYVVGLVGLMGSLLPLLLLSGDGADSASTAGSSAIRRLEDLDAAGSGAVDKPRFGAPPVAALDPTQDYVAVFELESGTVRIQLFDDVVPIHSNNFVFLIEEGFYDGLTFYRVLADEIAQTGDPSATGNGDAGYVLPDEGAPTLDEPLTLGDQGLIAMARTGAETSSSQFFITLSPQEQLDGLGFVPFGRVVEGLELVLALTPRNPLATPTPEAGDRILSASIETLPSGSVALELPTLSPAAAARAAAANEAAATSAAQAEAPPKPPNPGENVPVEKPTWPAPPEITIDASLDYTAVLELDTGTVRIDLFEETAPIHTNNFVFLAGQGFYDGLTFHRVIPGFVAQGGDPTATGTGGSGYNLPDEDVGDNAAALTNGIAGIIAMARGPLGASGSQFYITYSAQGRLDAEGFTAFGQVVDGMNAIDALPPRDPADPAAPAGGRIISVSIETAEKTG